MDQDTSQRDPRTSARPRAERSARGPAVSSRRRRLIDRLATWVVTAGGLAIIVSVLGILVFILAEVLPLFGGAEVAVRGSVALAQPGRGILTDEHRTHVATLGDDGRIRAFDLADGTVVLERPLIESADEGEGKASVPLGWLAFRAEPDQQLLAAMADDARVVAARLSFGVTFDDDRRRVRPAIGESVIFPFPAGAAPYRTFAARIHDDGGATGVAVVGDRALTLLRRTIETNLFTEETTASWSAVELEGPPGLVALLLDADGRSLFAGTSRGELVWWDLAGSRPAAPQIVSGGSPVTALTLLLGSRSLIVGRTDGSLAVWFPVRQTDDSFRLSKIREFPAHASPIRLLAPSRRDKGFLAQDEGGTLALYYSTSNRVLWSARSPAPGAHAACFAPKADGAYLLDGAELVALDIENPHPEVGWRALFGKVWYEGYESPAHVWQSTGGTDDFEPKLSLVPLMIGTLKGTIYSLLLAIPLGVLGAMYTSQFMAPKLKRYVKPTVEIMAALPSVVLGFLAGLWLAPRVEHVLPGLLLMPFVLPTLVVGAGFALRALPRSAGRRLPEGSEAILYAGILAAGGWACLAASGPLETLLFGGDFKGRLLSVTGLQYDQRNALIVGLAMGFAVIPIIFTMAEDAFSNVPRNLVSGSLALGANRWQTVTRVVLPTASPGIFSAIMIGFGRAVGETMIVLMATGNTPIMDWNPFNGFRTLSANIAVEIPEAPHGATLYRTLFLAALILFLFTFAINTTAEWIRRRLRLRYAER